MLRFRDNGRYWFPVFFISIGPTVLSLLFWNKDMKIIPLSRASLFLNTVPVYIIINAVFWALCCISIELSVWY